jgi:S1-C subfamily serine protease
MKTWKIVLAVAAALLLAEQAAAQSDVNAEQRRVEMARSEADVEERMREAEERLAEAARQIAELSSQRLSRTGVVERMILAVQGRPRLGVTIGGSDDTSPVEGVSVIGVTPGSAASEAGLRAGDTITAVNSESLSAASAEEANARLLDFMRGVEEGDKLDIEYLRNGNVGKVEVQPKVIESRAFGWAPGGGHFEIPHLPNVQYAPEAAERYRFLNRFIWTSDGWGDMELVELSEGLGRYFGTDSGLLVVSAPKSDTLKLQDGDVIQSIDGRDPNSVGHAIRILGSYQPGEKLELRIMRDKKRVTLKIEIPDDRSSMLFPQLPAPMAAP